MNKNQTHEIRNVSFIVIAHNEEFAINKCLKSITKMILVNCEVICIDSGSSDGTLDVIKSFIGQIENYKIIKISGYQNASIARNAGIEKALKDYVFFIDGDVELSSKFIVTSLDKIKHGEADALIGILKENQYNEDYSKIIKKIDNRTSITKEEIRYYCGGIFLTKKTIIDDIGVFDPSFTRAQDFDYTLRLSKKYTLRAIPTIMGTHHTIPYSNRLRLINEFKKMMPKYYGKALRKNIQNYKGCISFLNKNGYTKGIPILALLVSSLWKPQILLIALSFILIDVITGVMRNQNITARLSYHYIAPIMLIYGFFVNPNNHELLIRNTIVKILK